MQFTDQMNRIIRLGSAPQRIISLVPSQTELLFDLGLDERVVGITKFCIHPEKWFRSKTRVGGTKNVYFDKIAELKPDLIIANKEENKEAEIKTLMEHYPVWMSDIQTLEDALEMIYKIGNITQTTNKSGGIIQLIQDGFLTLQPTTTKKAAYFIWKNPLMSINQSRFIHDIMQRCGLTNVFSEKNADYPEIGKEELRKASPEVILLSSEPFPFQKKHLFYFQEICPKAQVILVDGEMFSWYGSRLNLAPDYFKKLLEEVH